MTKSFKMVTVLAMLDADCFPGVMGIDALTRASLVATAAIQADARRPRRHDGAARVLGEASCSRLGRGQLLLL